MSKTQTYPSILIIGAGIIGAAMAYRLARAGAAPIVVDAGAGGGEATAAAWAWLNASWGNPPPYARLRKQSLGLWRELGAEIPELPVRFCGSLTYDLSDADLETYALLSTDDYPIQIIGPDAIRAREPNLIDVPARAALCLAEGVAEPLASATILRQRAVALGAEFRPHTRVLGLITKGGAVTGAATDAGDIAAGIVVCCGGIGSPELLAGVGFDLPMTTPEGLLVHTEPLPRALTGLLVAPGMELRQTNTGRFVAGFDFTGSIVGEPGKAAGILVARINATLKLPEPARPALTTLGKRPTPKDGFPVIGFVPGVPELYVATMHSGMTLAAAVGMFGAAEILGEAKEHLLGPYRPDRFAQA